MEGVLAESLCMDCSSRQKLGLDDLPLLIGILVFLVLKRSILFFGDNIKRSYL